MAIKKRVLTPNQGLMAQTNADSTSTSAFKDLTKLGNDNDNAESNDNTEGSTPKANNTPTTANGFSVTKARFGLSPNPTHDQTTLTYQFSQPTDVTLVIETTLGQVVMNKILRGITVGSVDIQTSEWANGTYILSMQYGKEIKTKKFEVLH